MKLRAATASAREGKSGLFKLLGYSGTCAHEQRKPIARLCERQLDGLRKFLSRRRIFRSSPEAILAARTLPLRLTLLLCRLLYRQHWTSRAWNNSRCRAAQDKARQSSPSMRPDNGQVDFCLGYGIRDDVLRRSLANDCVATNALFARLIDEAFGPFHGLAPVIFQPSVIAIGRHEAQCSRQIVSVKNQEFSAVLFCQLQGVLKNERRAWREIRAHQNALVSAITAFVRQSVCFVAAFFMRSFRLDLRCSVHIRNLQKEDKRSAPQIPSSFWAKHVVSC
jgi:hypothetical protein